MNKNKAGMRNSTQLVYPRTMAEKKEYRIIHYIITDAAVVFLVCHSFVAI